MDSVGYWRQVTWIAGGNACSVLGWKEREQATTPVAVAAATALIAYLVVKDRGLSDSIMYPVVFGLAAIGFVYLAAFLYHMAVTPPQLAADGHRSLELERAQLNRRINELDQNQHAATDNRLELLNRTTESQRLQTENEILKAKLAQAETEADKRDLESARDAIWKQVDAAPAEQGLTHDKARVWLDSIRQMLDRIAPGASYKFHFSGWDHHDIMASVTSLRGIAGGLRVKEIRQ